MKGVKKVVVLPNLKVLDPCESPLTLPAPPKVEQATALFAVAPRTDKPVELPSPKPMELLAPPLTIQGKGLKRFEINEKVLYASSQGLVATHITACHSDGKLEIACKPGASIDNHRVRHRFQVGDQVQYHSQNHGVVATRITAVHFDGAVEVQVKMGTRLNPDDCITAAMPRGTAPDMPAALKATPKTLPLAPAAHVGDAQLPALLGQGSRPKV